MERQLTLAQMASELQLSQPTLRKLVAQGCPCWMNGKRYRFDPPSVQEWLAAQQGMHLGMEKRDDQR